MPLSENQMTAMKEKRKKILEQAVILFSENGYNGTSIKKIAEAAGVSFGSVFTYFENKERLLHAAVTEPLEEIGSQILDFDPDATDPLAEIEKMIIKHIKIYAGIKIYMNLITHIIVYSKNFTETFSELDHFHESLKTKLRLLITNGQRKDLLYKQDPEYSAVSYTSFLMGLRLNLTDDYGTGEMWQGFVPYAMQLFGPKRI